VHLCNGRLLASQALGRFLHVGEPCRKLDKPAQELTCADDGEILSDLICDLLELGLWVLRQSLSGSLADTPAPVIRELSIMSGEHSLRDLLTQRRDDAILKADMKGAILTRARLERLSNL
jgi:hypothetical protein